MDSKKKVLQVIEKASKETQSGEATASKPEEVEDEE